MKALKTYQFRPQKPTTWAVQLNKFYKKDVPFVFTRGYIYKNYFKPFYKNFFNN